MIYYKLPFRNVVFKFILLAFVLAVIFTGKSFLLSSQASEPKVIDQVASPEAAYSLRKLNSSYSGPAIEVRRDSDGARLDIGFTSQGDLDTAALVNFVTQAGADNTVNGHVVTWYDQSGNSSNLGQVDPNKQPKIYSDHRFEPYATSNYKNLTPQLTNCVFGDDDYLYVTDTSVLTSAQGTLQVLKREDSRPRLIDSIITEDLSTDVWVRGNYIFVATQNILDVTQSGLIVYEFDGFQIFRVDGLDTAGEAWSVFGDDNYIYVADGNSGLKAYTFDGTSLTLVGQIPTAFNARAVWVDENYVYVAADTDGIAAFTFDGTNFTQLTIFDTPGEGADLMGDGTYIYLADGSSGLRVCTFNGLVFNEIDFDLPEPASLSDQIWIESNYIHVANSVAGVVSYTFDGANFSKLANYVTNGDAIDVWSDRDYIYVADTNGGLRILSFDGSEYVEFSDEEALNNLAPPHQFSVDSDYIYSVVDDKAQVHKLEGRDLVLLDSFSIPSSLPYQDILCESGFCYLATGLDGIVVLSFDGKEFSFLDSIDTAGASVDIFIQSSYIFLNDLVSLYALSFDGTSLNSIDFVNFGSFVQDIWGDGTYIYAIDLAGTLYAFSFDGSNITLEATTSVNSGPASIAGDANYIYVADDVGGITAYSFNGTAFTNLGDTGSFGVPHSYMYENNGYIYISFHTQLGLKAFTFDGVAFTELDAQYANSIATVMVDDDFIYVSNYDGLEINVINHIEPELVTEQARPAISFDGLDDSLEVNLTRSIAQPNSIFTVAKNHSINSFSQDLYSSLDGDYGHSVGVNGFAKFQVRAGNGSVTNFQIDFDNSIYSLIFEAASSSFYRNTKQISSSFDGGADSLSGLRLGANFDGSRNFWNGLVQEFLIYPKKHKDKNRKIIENSAIDYYNLVFDPNSIRDRNFAREEQIRNDTRRAKLDLNTNGEIDFSDIVITFTKLQKAQRLGTAGLSLQELSELDVDNNHTFNSDDELLIQRTLQEDPKYSYVSQVFDQVEVNAKGKFNFKTAKRLRKAFKARRKQFKKLKSRNKEIPESVLAFDCDENNLLNSKDRTCLDDLLRSALQVNFSERRIRKFL